MFDENITSLIAKNRRRGLLIDTNLLLLIVGSYQTDRINSELFDTLLPRIAGFQPALEWKPVAHNQGLVRK